jgi:hypothetical protein
MLKWFCDTSTGVAIGAARCGSFVGGAFVSWLLAMDERGGHDDLRGSGLGVANDVLHGVSSVESSCLLTLLY